jgi:uncharacterized protein YndB with AHSA1/START domain
MADIRLEIVIAAAPEKIRAALSSREGLRGWWTGDATAADEVGAVAEFGFFNRAVTFRMRVEELAAARVRWTCIGGPAEWIGTQVLFELNPAPGGPTTVRFVHSGWRAEDGMYPSATSTWFQIMPHLKRYAESGAREPYFTAESD